MRNYPNHRPTKTHHMEGGTTNNSLLIKWKLLPALFKQRNSNKASYHPGQTVTGTYQRQPSYYLKGILTLYQTYHPWNRSRVPLLIRRKPLQMDRCYTTLRSILAWEHTVCIIHADRRRSPLTPKLNANAKGKSSK